MQLPRDQVLALDPDCVEEYLQSHGWKADPRASSVEVGVYRSPADPEAEILLPRNRGFVDYALRLSEVIVTLGAAEHRKAWEVLEELGAQRAGTASPNGPVSGKLDAAGSEKATRKKRL
jgi:hypothetical protein